MKHFDKYEAGKTPITAAGLNKLIAELQRVGKITGAPPIQVTSTAQGYVISFSGMSNPSIGALCVYDATLNDNADPWEKNSNSPLRIYDGACCFETDTGNQLLACNKFGPIPNGNFVFVVSAGAAGCNYAVATECG